MSIHPARPCGAERLETAQYAPIRLYSAITLLFTSSQRTPPNVSLCASTGDTSSIDAAILTFLALKFSTIWRVGLGRRAVRAIVQRAAEEEIIAHGQAYKFKKRSQDL